MEKKRKIVNILEMANLRVKWRESWDLGVLVEHVCGTFDSAVVKVIWGAFDALAIFRKYDVQNAASSTLIILFESNFYRCNL